MHLVHALPYPVFSLQIINDHIKSNIIITMERELKCSQNKSKIRVSAQKSLIFVSFVIRLSLGCR